MRSVVDASRQSSYLAAMVNRLFLTLLALLTGLAAQTGPAHARIRSGGESEIGLTAAVPCAERIEQMAHVVLARAVDAGAGPSAVSPPALVSRTGVHPVVRLRSDRARE